MAGGVMDRIFEKLQLEQIVCIRIEAFRRSARVREVFVVGQGGDGVAGELNAGCPGTGQQV